MSVRKLLLKYFPNDIVKIICLLRNPIYIGKKGYTISLSQLTEDKITQLKEDLTFKPFRPRGYGPDIEPFSVYGISKSKIFIPKFYGISTFGEPEEIKTSKGDNIKLKFNGSLRKNQVAPVDACLKAANETGGGILCLGCGFGKCLGLNTPVMMYDGTIKMVQNIKVGDLLMGDDSTPRKVLSTCRGKEQLYEVIPKKGDSYIVNESHVLSLKCSTNKINKLQKGDIVDIPVKKYLNLPYSNKERQQFLLGYRVPVNFPEKKINFDPYIIGLWLGDSSSRGIRISVHDSSVLVYLVKNLGKYNMYLEYSSQYNYYLNSINKDNCFRNELKEKKLINNKHIPIIYKCNSRKVRLKLLSGLLDSAGLLLSKYGYDIIETSEKMIDDIVYLARSLGFAAYKKKYKKSYTFQGKIIIGYFYRTNIYGPGIEKLPVLIKRNKIALKEQFKNVLSTQIKIKKQKFGDYYGFEIDGNRRFLLGDFTVTHNTSIALYLIAKLSKKALVVVNKEFLMDQWKERIQQFLPEARIGILRQKKVDIEEKDIVIAMLQSVAMCDYNLSTYESFGIVFYDEVHCVPSKVFSKALRKINTRYHFGLSATPNRADGMTKVTKLYIGPIVYKIDSRKAKKNPKKLQVFTISFDELPNGKLYKERKNYQGRPDVVRMISNIIKCPKRLALMSMILRYFIIKDKRHILVLSERIQYLRDIEEKIKKDLKNNVPFKIGYYIGGMKEKERKESESADLILASYSMAKEAMDIPILDTLLMATSKSNIEQSVGRIQRKMEYPENRPPLVIDFIDKFSSFHRQSYKRIEFYRKKHYPVTEFTFNNEKPEELYDDFDEKIKIISENINNIEDSDSEDLYPNDIENNLLPKPLVQTKINKDFYDLVGNGDFEF